MTTTTGRPTVAQRGRNKLLALERQLSDLYGLALEDVAHGLEPTSDIGWGVRLDLARWVVEMHDGKPRQDVRGSGLASTTINVVLRSPQELAVLERELAILERQAQLPGGQTVDAQYRVLGPALDMPQDATGEAREAVEGGEASPVLPIRVSPPFKGKSPPPVPPAPHSTANLYGFEDCKKPVHKPTSKAKAKLPGTLPNDYSANLERKPAPIDGPGAAPNAREALYAQRQAQLRALEEAQRGR